MVSQIDTRYLSVPRPAEHGSWSQRAVSGGRSKSRGQMSSEWENSHHSFRCMSKRRVKPQKGCQVRPTEGNGRVTFALQAALVASDLRRGHRQGRTLLAGCRPRPCGRVGPQPAGRAACPPRRHDPFGMRFKTFIRNGPSLRACPFRWAWPRGLPVGGVPAEDVAGDGRLAGQARPLADISVMAWWRRGVHFRKGVVRARRCGAGIGVGCRCPG